MSYAKHAAASRQGFNPKFVSWLSVSTAPTGRATCKYAACGEGVGGAIEKGARIIVPINVKCGGKMGSYHVECFFRAQETGASNGTDKQTAVWTHTSPFTNCRFTCIVKQPGHQPGVAYDVLEKTANAIISVEQFEGWAELTPAEQAHLRKAATLRGTGHGTTMKAGKREFDATPADSDTKQKQANSKKKGAKRSAPAETSTDGAEVDDQQPVAQPSKKSKKEGPSKDAKSSKRSTKKKTGNQ